MTIRIGQKYVKHTGAGKGGEYLLAHVETGNKVVLIDVTGGKRWTDPIRVSDVWDISPEEWDQLSRSPSDEWVLIS
jgi:hypothetical protein